MWGKDADVEDPGAEPNGWMNEKAEGDVGVLTAEGWYSGERGEWDEPEWWVWTDCADWGGGESGECVVYCDDGEASCVRTDTADSVPELPLVPVLSEDNDVCTLGSSRIELEPIPTPAMFPLFPPVAPILHDPCSCSSSSLSAGIALISTKCRLSLFAWPCICPFAVMRLSTGELSGEPSVDGGGTAESISESEWGYESAAVAVVASVVAWVVPDETKSLEASVGVGVRAGEGKCELVAERESEEESDDDVVGRAVGGRTVEAGGGAGSIKEEGVTGVIGVTSAALSCPDTSFSISFSCVCSSSWW
jgi:hypothetical protein